MDAPSSLALWPGAPLSPAGYLELWANLRPAFLARLAEHRIPEPEAGGLAALVLPLAAWIRHRKGSEPLVLGVNGAQGSGKSTLCDLLARVLASAYGWRVAGFSLDDLYKTRAERQRLSREVHPLLLTRGVPGTHDIDLGLATLHGLKSAEPWRLTALPSFDKARDDQRPEPEWPRFRGRPDVVLFEGWCVGSVPQADAALVQSINELEREEDPDGTWRRHVNGRLGGEYAALFGELDRLVMLKVPGMESVFGWRRLQERKLAEATGPAGRHRLMDDSGLRRFILHYERLTRHALEEMPTRADLTLELDENRRLTAVRSRPG